MGRCLGPVEDDHQGEEQAAEGVEPPYATIEANYITLVNRPLREVSLVISKLTKGKEDGPGVEYDIGDGVVSSWRSVRM